MEWARILAYITGTVDQQLLLRNEYLVAENRILRAQLHGRLRLSDAERTRLGEIVHRLGRKALSELATAALPETILPWYRRLVARKFDGSRAHRRPGRPPIDKEVEELTCGDGEFRARYHAVLTMLQVRGGRVPFGHLVVVGSGPN
jgi:putative transposase